MKRETFYWWLRIVVIHLSAFNLGLALRGWQVGVHLSVLIGTLAVWVEVTFKPKRPAPDPTLCDCGAGAGAHRVDCRLIRALEPYARRAPR